MNNTWRRRKAKRNGKGNGRTDERADEQTTNGNRNRKGFHRVKKNMERTNNRPVLTELACNQNMELLRGKNKLKVRRCILIKISQKK